MPLREISPILQLIVLLSEDVNFFAHRGIDLRRVMGALWLDLRRRRFVTGGSCITQQLAKNLYFSFEKILARKVAELFVVYHLERNYTKLELFELYLNIISYGRGQSGIGAASQFYFHCTPAELTLPQALSLAVTLPAPRWRNPSVDKARWEKFYQRLEAKLRANALFPPDAPAEALPGLAQARLDHCAQTRRAITHL